MSTLENIGLSCVLHHIYMKVVYTKVVSFIRVQVHTLAGVAILGGHKGTPPTILWLATYMTALP